jgi:hypothetical protein
MTLKINDLVATWAERSVNLLPDCYPIGPRFARAALIA